MSSSWLVVVTAEIGDLRLRNSELRRLEVRQELNDHNYCFVTIMGDRNDEVRLEDLLGAPITIKVEIDKGPKGKEQKETATIFKGKVTGGSETYLLQRGTGLSVQAASESIALQHHFSAKYYRNSSFAEVARDAGAQIVGPAPEECDLNYVQLEQSDFDFLLRVADDHGYFLRVRPEDGAVEARQEFMEDAPLELAWGRNLLSLSAHSRLVNAGFRGAAYEIEEKKDYRFHGVHADPPMLGGAHGLTRSVHDKSDPRASKDQRFDRGGDPNWVGRAGRSPTLAALKQSLEHESERVLGGSVFVEGSSTEIHLTPGAKIDVSGSDAFPLALTGQLGLTRVVHRFDGQQYGNDFRAYPWARFRSPRAPASPTAPGPVSAEVVEVDDPRKMGRVRVRYRWQDASEVTGWVRVAAPYAGKERGVMFIPEIGDEVLVAFLDGNLEQPVVLGSLWNGQDLSLYESDNYAKRIVTRAGNRIELWDEPGNEKVEITSPEAKCAVLLHADHGGKPTVTIYSAGDLSLEADGELRISCSKLVESIGGDALRDVTGKDSRKVGGDFLVQAQGSIKGGAQMTAALHGGVNSDLTAGTTVNVSSGMVQIQPPGFVAQPATADPVPDSESAWKEKDVPPETEAAKSQQDAPTPRG